MKKQLNRRVVLTCVAACLALVLGLCLVPRTTIPDNTSQVAPVVTRDYPSDEEQDATAPEADKTDTEAPAQSVAPDASDESDDMPEPSPDAVEERPMTFTMPEDATYDPELALCAFDPSTSAEQANAALASIEGVVSPNVTEDDIAYGYAHLELEQGVSVEDVINQLQALDVVRRAQPNYIYPASDFIESEPDVSALQPSEPEQIAENNEPAESTDVEEEADDADGAAAADEDADAGEEVSQSTSEEESLDAVEEESEDIEADDESQDVEAEASRVTVNDPRAGSQWGLESIRAPEAWALQHSPSKKVTVAVMDMGFYVGHPDLAGMTVAPYSAHDGTSNVAPLTYMSNGRSVTYEPNHGTHVAGIIAAKANNGAGVAGACFDNVQVMPIRIASPNPNGGEPQVTAADFERAFRHVIAACDQYNIRVINMSVGTKATSFGELLEDEIRTAYTAHNIVTVASAGNLNSSGSSPFAHYPSDVEECVAVMCLKQGTYGVDRWERSNYNTRGKRNKDICAPGVDILSTCSDNDYCSLSGTSMATPFVSSVIALEFAAKPSLSAAEAVNILYSTSVDLGASGWDESHGYGAANAYYALYALRYGLSSAQQLRSNEVRQEQQRIENERNTAAYNSVKYRTHVQTYGWQGWKSAGAMSGTSHESKRLEAINIKLEGAPYSGGICYRTHVQSYGWQGWKYDGAMSGTSHEAKRLEAIEIKLTGEMANHYSVWYRVHAQTYGWMGWTRDGGRAGTATLAKRLEAIEIRILPKSAGTPGSTDRPYVTRQVKYRTHVQSFGWQGHVFDGATAGTTGSSKRLEGINITLPDKLYGGGIRYRTHVQTYGWQGWKYDGAMSGTSGQSKRLEAIVIELYGDMAAHYDVWYRVHAQTFGWMGWAKNGENAGTAGFSKRLEAIQIRVLPKGSAAPGSTDTPFRQR